MAAYQQHRPHDSLNEILPLRIGKNPDDFTVCLRWLSSLEPFWRLLFVLEPDLAIRQEE